MALNDLAAGKGFKPAAAIAAVAEHTLMPTVSHTRPDADDAKILRQFGQMALQQANEGKSLSKIPGEKGEMPDIIF